MWPDKRWLVLTPGNHRCLCPRCCRGDNIRAIIILWDNESIHVYRHRSWNNEPRIKNNSPWQQQPWSFSWLLRSSSFGASSSNSFISKRSPKLTKPQVPVCWRTDRQAGLKARELGICHNDWSRPLKKAVSRGKLGVRINVNVPFLLPKTKFIEAQSSGEIKSNHAMSMQLSFT